MPESGLRPNRAAIFGSAHRKTGPSIDDDVPGPAAYAAEESKALTSLIAAHMEPYLLFQCMHAMLQL